MVNHKRVMESNWLQMKPVKSNQQWHQSTCSDSWAKQLHRNTKVVLDKRNVQKEAPPNTPRWANQKKQLSPKGKQFLRQKVEEVVSYNSSKIQPNHKQIGETIDLSKKDKRARCYICKKRGHVFWKCTNKGIHTKIQEATMTNPTISKVQETLKYEPGRVHVTTDYMVEGSDQGNWNDIWFVSSAYKRHMSHTRTLFRRMMERFKKEGTEEQNKKSIFSYGVGEAIVETKEGSLVIPNVLYTPEITLNVLSIDQLEEQGFIVTYGNGTCGLKYMFDNGKRPLEVQDEGIMAKDEGSMIECHNKYLDEYFQSIDPEEECSLIKGMEDLKMDKGDVQDYIDNEYLSLNGTLYFMKVNTFPRFLSFLDLIKIDKLVYGNWEVLRGKFMELPEWFYIGYLNRDVLGSLPPVIGVTKVDLLGLYKFVDDLGGYMNVTFNDKWYQVANILGLANEHHETVKEVYKEYIGMVKVYYEEAKRSRHEEPGDVAENCRGTAGKERPQVNAKIDAEVEEMPDETPRKRSRTEREEDVNNGGNYEATNHVKEASTSSSDDFIIIT
ncbi:ARID DNA-binding domain-containing protein [Tanacetum coccineum]